MRASSSFKCNFGTQDKLNANNGKLCHNEHLFDHCVFFVSIMTRASKQQHHYLLFIVSGTHTSRNVLGKDSESAIDDRR